MKIVIKQQLLNSQLALAQSMIGRNGFSYLAFDAKDKLTIRAFGNDSNLELVTECDIFEEGSTCIHTNKLTDLTKLLNGEVSINTSSNGRATIKDSKKDSFKIATLERSMFPEVLIPAHLTYEVDTAKFKQAVEAVSFAIPHADNERFTMRCGRLTINENGLLELVTTDGQRIADVQIQVEEPLLGELEMLVSERGLVGMEKLCSYGSTLRLGQDDSHIYAKVGDVSCAFYKLVGTFPNTSKVLSTEDSEYKSVVCKTSELKLAIRKVSLLSDSLSVVLELADGVMKVSVQGVEGEGTVSIPAKGDINIKLLVNSRFILEFLETVTAEDLYIYFKNPTALVRFCPVEEKRNVVYMMAPMRMQG